MLTLSESERVHGGGPLVQPDQAKWPQQTWLSLGLCLYSTSIRDVLSKLAMA